MANVSISKKPSRKVSNLAVTRDGNKFVGKWKVPSAATSTQKADRFTGLHIQWRLDVANAGVTDPVDKDKTSNERATSNNQTYGEFKGGTKGWGSLAGQQLSRGSLYPCTGILVSAIRLRVRGYNSFKGKTHYGPFTGYASYTFGAPRQPSVEFSYDESTMVVSWTISTDEGTDNYERYDTAYRVWATRSGASNVTIAGTTSSTSTKIQGSHDISTMATWSNGTVVTVYVEAWARGLAGDSGHVTKSYAVSYPPRPSIKSITESSGRVCVSVSVNAGRVAEAKLQRQLNVQPGQQPSAGDWGDVDGAVDNGDCSALFDVKGNAISTNGLYTWYRIRVKNKNFIDYSEAMRADCLFTKAPTAEDDTCTIISATAGDDGLSAAVVIGIDEDSANTGTEVSWSENPDAWSSTDPPNTFTFTWLDTASRDQRFGKTTEILIRGLKEGTAYYIRARRYLEGDDRTSYSPYSAAAVVEPATRPASVSLTAPGYVARGEDVECSWTFSGDSAQTAYRIMPASGTKSQLVGGDDSLGYAIIPAERYGSASSLSFYVSVSAGGSFTDSNAVSVRIADPPTCECGATPTLTAQPASFEVYSDAMPGRLLATCTSAGTQHDTPTGDDDQLPGDVVWTSAVEPEWELATWGDTILYENLGNDVTAAADRLSDAEDAAEGLEPGDEGYDEAMAELANAQFALADAQAALAAHPSSGAVYVSTVSMGSGLDFVDGRGYSVECKVVDTVTGLDSGYAECGFEVGWAHQAPAPPDEVEIVPDVDDRSVSMTLPAPEGAVEGDVYDVYRKVPEGYELVGTGILPGSTLLDRYAPFGTEAELAYRVCVRTQDGDIEFADFGYEMPVDLIRVDFGSEFIELPYNMSSSTRFSKGFEARHHMGEGKPGGYYDGTLDRTASFSTSIMKLGNPEQVNTARRLAAYVGPVFVRTSTGTAFEGNVDCSFDWSYSNGGVSMKLDATETDPTDEFMLKSIDVEEGQVENG